MLIDSSAIIHLLNGTLKGKEIEQYIAEITSTSAVCVHEVLSGATQSERSTIADLFRGLEILPFDCSAAQMSPEIKKRIIKAGKTIGELDVFIAATALAHNIPLLTTDKDFKNVEGLQVVLV